MKKSFFSLALVLIPGLLVAGFVKEYNETGGNLSIKNHPQPFLTYAISADVNETI